MAENAERAQVDAMACLEPSLRPATPPESPVVATVSQSPFEFSADDVTGATGDGPPGGDDSGRRFSDGESDRGVDDVFLEEADGDTESEASFTEELSWEEFKTFRRKSLAL